MGKFMKGLSLCEQFFEEAAKPVLKAEFPALRYSAGLIGYGSDVLGYDDEVSVDHMWGPRFYLFLREEDLSLKHEILDLFSKKLPYEYKGFSVNFSAPDPQDHGVRHPVWISEGPVSPLIFIYSFEEYLRGYLGVSDFERLSETDWLSFSEHRLLALTSGTLFVDGLHLKEQLRKISFYPEEIRLFLIASNWSLIAEEQAFVKRCSDVGDELGSILACVRICERLMRLAFLYCGRYAPYSKWFGTAFRQLPIEEAIKIAIHGAMTAKSISDREEHLVTGQKLLADWHDSFRITEPVNVKIQSYFGRSSKVIYADRIAEAVKGKLKNTPLFDFPLVGTMSEVSNFVTLSDNPLYRKNIKLLYTGR